MVLSTQFYDFLHELEEDGSISRFDWKDPRLKKLHILASGSVEDRKKQFIKLLERGYDKHECAAETEFPVSQIEKIRREAKIPIVPRFNYLVDGEFYADVNSLRKVFKIPTTADSITYLRFYRHSAYHLDHFHWEQIPIGAHLYNKFGKMRIKKAHDIRSYKKYG